MELEFVVHSTLHWAVLAYSGNQGGGPHDYQDESRVTFFPERVRLSPFESRVAELVRGIQNP